LSVLLIWEERNLGGYEHVLLLLLLLRFPRTPPPLFSSPPKKGGGDSRARDARARGARAKNTPALSATILFRRAREKTHQPSNDIVSAFLRAY
jgi:hypothetical protein